MAGDVVAQRYELEQLVGSGGMSSVFRAHDRVLERTVALKMLHERLTTHQDVVDRFSREAKLVAGLSHHNIVSVIDRGDDGGSPFIVFEYVAGENLKQVVVRDGPLPVERVLELGVEIARALAFAHEKGFVHRDVKPQNVLLNGKGEAKVTDFGIARPIEAREGETQTGTVLGTCDYISPEQAQGRHVDALTDEYSLGVVLYELLTGEVPFSGDNFVAIAMQHINAPPPPVSLKRPEVPAPCRGRRRAGARQGPRRALPDDGGLCGRARGVPRRASRRRGHGRDRHPPGRQTGTRGAPCDAERSPASPAQHSPRRAGHPRRDRDRDCRLRGTRRPGLAGGGRRRPIDNGRDRRDRGRRPTTPKATATRTTPLPRSRPTETPAPRGRPSTTRPRTSATSSRGSAWSSTRARPSRPSRSRSARTRPAIPRSSRPETARTGPFARRLVLAARRRRPPPSTLNGAKARYYLIWITNLGPSNQVSVNEVTAK